MNDITPAPTTEMPPPMELALCASFGSFAQWRDSFLAIGAAHGAEAGSVELVFIPGEGALRNRWAAGAASGHGNALLALPLPVEAGSFVAGIAWPAVYERYQHAVHAASEPFAARQDDVGDALVLDVRRAGIFATAPTMLPGASWRDPAAVREWAGALPTGRELIVYCVYGHEVGRATALRLRARGLNARFLEGGIDAWQSAGRATVPNTDADAQ
jgi:superoxide dismutase, Fe-Mn family